MDSCIFCTYVSAYSETHFMAGVQSLATGHTHRRRSLPSAVSSALLPDATLFPNKPPDNVKARGETCERKRDLGDNKSRITEFRKATQWCLEVDANTSSLLRDRRRPPALDCRLSKRVVKRIKAYLTFYCLEHIQGQSSAEKALLMRLHTGRVRLYPIYNDSSPCPSVHTLRARLHKALENHAQAFCFLVRAPPA